jgi:hypothetical protein
MILNFCLCSKAIYTVIFILDTKPLRAAPLFKKSETLTPANSACTINNPCQGLIWTTDRRTECHGEMNLPTPTTFLVLRHHWLHWNLIDTFTTYTYINRQFLCLLLINSKLKILNRTVF